MDVSGTTWKVPHCFVLHVTVLLVTSREPTRSVVIILVISFQTELMVEIYFKSPVGANGEVLLMKFS